MSAYRLFGAETSPYSIKIRALLRYKDIGFQWIEHDKANEAEFKTLARGVSLPLFLSPNRPASQDSTSIMAALEADVPEPSIVPDDPACACLALILEDYADEWLNKIVMYNRWGRRNDREQAGMRAMEHMLAGDLPRARKKMRDQIVRRMRENLPMIGIQKKNEKVFKSSSERFFKHLDAHLVHNAFVFGGRPSSADFALSGQVTQALMDPTLGDWLRAWAPSILGWHERMARPQAEGPFKTFGELEEGLSHLFANELAVTYLPWAQANMNAAANRSERISLTLDKRTYEQVTQYYAARAYRSVVEALATVMSKAGTEADAGLNAFLDRTGARLHLA